MATAAVIGFGFTAANQLYGLAGSVMPRHEAGHAMGVVSLGAGLFGYFGPQMLGILRDQTGSFAAGFYMVAIADVITLVLIAVLYRMTRGETHMKRQFVTCMCALALSLTVSAQAPARGTGDQRRQYVFAPTGQQMPYRIYVPKTWDGKASLPIILMLHGAGANEGTYLDQADGLLMKLAEQHRYIVVSPLGFTPLGAYGNPLRLPAVFGQSAAAASQRAADAGAPARAEPERARGDDRPGNGHRGAAPIARARIWPATRWAAAARGIWRPGIPSGGARWRRCRGRSSTRRRIRSIASSGCRSS